MPSKDLQARLECPGGTRRVTIVGEGGASRRDGLGEDGANRPYQAPDGLGIDGSSRGRGMHAGKVERLVNVDVPEAGHHSLVEQDGLDGGPAPGQRKGKAVLIEQRPRLGGVFRVERFGSQASEEATEVRRTLRKGEAPELALVRETEGSPVVHRDGRALVPERRRVHLLDSKATGHPKVDDEGAIVIELKQEVLSPPVGPDALRARK